MLGVGGRQQRRILGQVGRLFPPKRKAKEEFWSSPPKFFYAMSSRPNAGQQPGGESRL